MRNSRGSKKQTTESFLGMSIPKGDEEEIKERLDLFLEDHFRSFYDEAKRALKNGEDGVYQDFGEEDCPYGMHVELDSDDDLSFEIYGDGYESYLTFYAKKTTGALLSVYVEIDDTKLLFEMLDALDDL